MRYLIAIQPVVKFVDMVGGSPIVFPSEDDAALEVTDFDEEPRENNLVKIKLSRKGYDVPLWTAAVARYTLAYKPYLVWRDIQEPEGL